MSQQPHLIECCIPDCRRPRRDDPADSEDAPPLCTHHIIRIAAFAMREARSIERTDYDARPLKEDTREPLVYYVRVGDHVKIGTTIDLRGRLRAMYLDESAVLATEPGHYQLENQRHREFADERVHANRELFNPSPRLMAHIERLTKQAA